MVRHILAKLLEFRLTHTEMAYLLAARTSYFRGYPENRATSHHHHHHTSQRIPAGRKRLGYLGITGWFQQSDTQGGRLGIVAILQLPGLGPPRYSTNHELRASPNFFLPSSSPSLLSFSIPQFCSLLQLSLGVECAYLQVSWIHMCLCFVCAPLHACGLVYMHAWCFCVQMCVCSVCAHADRPVCMHACSHARYLGCTHACLFCEHEPRACTPVCIRAGVCMLAPV